MLQPNSWQLIRAICIFASKGWLPKDDKSVTQEGKCAVYKKPGGYDGRYDGLELLRGIAALLVVAFHTWALNGVTLPSYLEPIARHFDLAVQMFFILSAFCLCLGYYNRINDRIEIKKYLVRRIFRIVPLFYFMIALGC